MLMPEHRAGPAVFLELSAVRLIGRPLAVILPFSFFPFGVYLAYIYFSTSISRDLLERPGSTARASSGSSGIAMPLATPVIALVGFFSFVGNWNNYFLPFVTVPYKRRRFRWDSPSSSRCPPIQSHVRRHDEHLAADPGAGDPHLGRAGVYRLSFRPAILASGMTAGGTKG